MEKRSTIMSEAETLGELKRDLTANGINYSGKTFMEGLSRSELKEDASILPHDIQRPDGSVTNELVFMLTEPEYSTFARPFAPDLVVISTTPPAALEP